MWQVVGQTKTISFLKRSLAKKALAHAYLLIGPTHTGKMTLALNLAKALNCEADEPPCGECSSCQKIIAGKHADVQIIGLTANGNSVEARTRTEIGIDQIRQLQHSAGLPPFEGRCKLFIIDGAEFMSSEAANCLLKTLEEPGEKMVFILLTTNERLLPATVVSRCQRLELQPLAAAELEAALCQNQGVDPEQARLLSRLAHGCPGWAIQTNDDPGLLQQRTEKIDQLIDTVNADYEERFTYAAQLATQFSQNRSSVQEILRLWQDWWRDLMLIKTGSGDIITNIDFKDTLVKMAGEYSLAGIKDFITGIQEACIQLRRNASPRLVLEVLMLDMPRRDNG
ncbi:DNA polymerase III subunit delta' [Chloroflexota bacterium]